MRAYSSSVSPSCRASVRGSAAVSTEVKASPSSCRVLGPMSACTGPDVVTAPSTAVCHPGGGAERTRRGSSWAHGHLDTKQGSEHVKRLIGQVGCLLIVARPATLTGAGGP